MLQGTFLIIKLNFGPGNKSTRLTLLVSKEQSPYFCYLKKTNVITRLSDRPLSTKLYSVNDKGRSLMARCLADLLNPRDKIEQVEKSEAKRVSTKVVRLVGL